MFCPREGKEGSGRQKRCEVTFGQGKRDGKCVEKTVVNESIRRRICTERSITTQ